MGLKSGRGRGSHQREQLVNTGKQNCQKTHRKGTHTHTPTRGSRYTSIHLDRQGDPVMSHVVLGHRISSHI